MDFQLSDGQRLLRDTVREFARAEIAPVAEELDRTKSFPYELVARMGELGLMGIPFEEEYGGGGADTLAYALCVEELARVDSSVAIPLAAHASLGTMPIHLWGSDEQKSRVAACLCRGERLAAFGLTEPEAGSDAGATRTRARLDGDEWVIDGSKQFITNAGTEISGCVTITAVTGDDERSEGDLEHHRPQRHAGLRAGRAVPQDGLERVRHPAASVQRVQGSGTEPARAPRRGLQELPPHPRRRPDRRGRDGRRPGPGALDEAVSYAKERRAFGQPISKFQAIQAKIADISAQLEAARLLTYRAAIEKDRGESFTLMAAQAKLITGRLAVRACEEAVQIHGGYGYIEEYPVCRFYRDAKILTIGEGTDEIQQLVIARQLGAEFGSAAELLLVCEVRHRRHKDTSDDGAYTRRGNIHVLAGRVEVSPWKATRSGSSWPRCATSSRRRTSSSRSASAGSTVTARALAEGEAVRRGAGRLGRLDPDNRRPQPPPGRLGGARPPRRGPAGVGR